MRGCYTLIILRKNVKTLVKMEKSMKTKILLQILIFNTVDERSDFGDTSK